jgi:hypothetical protein
LTPSPFPFTVPSRLTGISRWGHKGGALQAAEKCFQAVIPSGDFMIFGLTTLHENGLLGDKSFTFNESFRHSHGSEESRPEYFRDNARFLVVRQ